MNSVVGSEAGKTKITVSPEITEGNSYKYKTGANPTIPEAGSICSSGYTNWDGVSEITATTGQKIVIVEVDSGNRCVGAGMAEIVSAAAE